ncbi:hypothetical protein PK35_01520 [Tamlana nanhaiensis]|uniref:Lipid/polyisoprenoid-binding YceI-like domain-containing protein n=1 Tax=Neotamlana nanhaiensis TaxID=1382798 RepID=A0A0D7W644_9FLAO|nr:YceI family protein [Tamlana nanhaiensis]KJD34499.1 hypothetical protein PK35_01520 [Tamlana nanhaiensis]
MTLLKTIARYKLLACILILFVSQATIAQQFKLNNTSTLSVLGTSSLHDWHITSKTYSGSIAFNDLNSGDLKNLNISIPAESLKSGKNAMDKNTYKALKTNKYSTITFQLTKVNGITKKSDGKYTAKTTGNLTIAGVKKSVPLEFEIDATTSNVVKLVGKKTFKMTDFNIDPPTALLGTITTGDDVTIEFNSVFK